MYDVIVAGYGPTGMLAAILLGRAGHRVCVLERYTTLYNLPRVGIVHDDIQRMFQEIGCMERVLPAMEFLPVYELANEGRVLLSSKVATMATHGWPEFISVYQPAFEAELDTLARAEPNIELHQGETVVGVEQTPNSVVVITDRRAGVIGESPMFKVESKYFIGADGGNSFVREAIGVEYEDLGFDQAWLVIDAKARRPQRADLPYMRQFCEPAQPGMTMRMGPHHRRWSFMLFDGEDPAEATRPENIWRRLDRREGGTPDEFELIRAVNYQFRSLLAAPWRRGRVFLAGDACHQMPPFLAQGLCSGFRDAYNLAWKLDLVLKGQAPDAFLDTYEQERGPNARATILESAAVGQNVIERDVAKARERDQRLLAMQAVNDSVQDSLLIAFRVPGYEAGLIANGAPAAGDAFGQARVGYRGARGRFDDVVGRGWLIVARSGDPTASLSAEDAAFWSSLGGQTFLLGEGDGEVQDVDGYYTRLLDAYACDAIVKRPDYYIFGASPTVEGLGALIAGLRRQLS
jgi:2-polyprenyl-6-methoxyphenol hydroxylase-like FAD-dependent oxidoreductase